MCWIADATTTGHSGVSTLAAALLRSNLDEAIRACGSASIGFAFVVRFVLVDHSLRLTHRDGNQREQESTTVLEWEIFEHAPAFPYRLEFRKSDFHSY